MAASAGPGSGRVVARKPRYCVWELTLACNLRCGHCGSRAGRPRADELETAECLDLVRSLARLGCQVITLSGGEPTLRRDWATIASEIRQRGMIPNMVTNGIALNERVAQQMKEAGLANVAVSVDGPRDVHDRIRGAGAFDKTTRALRILRDVGIPTTVMTTINTLNLSRLEETHDIAVALGANRWRSQLGKPMGSMQDNADLVITPTDLLTLLPRLYELHLRDQVEVSIGDSLGYYGPYDSQLRAVSWDGRFQRWAGCQAGLQSIGVEANGGVKGCLSMQAFGGEGDPFVEGNVRARSLESIWLDPDSFAYNRCYSPDSLAGFCRSCTHSRLCRGGARCVAAAVTGGLAEDPYCYYRVSYLTTHRPSARLRQQIATAASIFSLLGAGCGAFPPDATPEGATSGIQCDEVCCDCGDEIPADVYEICCAPVSRYGVATPDYGDTPPEGQLDECFDCEYGDTPPAVDCSEICCDCPYDEIPDGYYECCEPAVADDYGDVPPSVDCSQVCCDCDYGDLPPEYDQCCVGTTPPYGVGVPEACLTVDEICDDFACGDVCAADNMDYGVVPPPLVPECGICCEEVIAPAYGIALPAAATVEVARFGLDLTPQVQVVTEELYGLPTVEGERYPRDLSLAVEAGDAVLAYRNLQPYQQDDVCGYCSYHQGCSCQPGIGVCSVDAPAGLVSGPLFGLINADEPVAPLVLDPLSHRLLAAPTPQLAAVAWSDLYPFDETAWTCGAQEQVSIIQRDATDSGLHRVQLALFESGAIAWVQAVAREGAPGALVMERSGELALYTPQGGAGAERLVVPPPQGPVLTEPRMFLVDAPGPVLASAPLDTGFVAVGITTTGHGAAAGDRQQVPAMSTTPNRLAFFTAGCGVAVPQVR